MLSLLARQRLTAELDRLVTAERPALVATTVSCDTLGDSADLALRTGMLMELERIDARIAQLHAMLAEARTPPAAPESIVTPGRVVTLKFGDAPSPERFLFGIVEERDSDLALVTPRSPLGRVLLGARAGSHVTYRPRPDRPELEVHVVEVVDHVAA